MDIYAYFFNLVRSCLSDLREKLKVNPDSEVLKDRPEYDLLIDYLKQHEVDELYSQLQNGTLPQGVKEQFYLYTEEVEDIAR